MSTPCVADGRAALKAAAERDFDCLMLDLRYKNGLAVREEIRKNRRQRLPIIAYTARDLSSAEKTRLRELAASVIAKGPNSVARLLDESALFLHRPVAGLPE